MKIDSIELLKWISLLFIALIGIPIALKNKQKVKKDISRFFLAWSPFITLAVIAHFTHFNEAIAPIFIIIGFIAGIVFVIKKHRQGIIK